METLALSVSLQESSDHQRVNDGRRTAKLFKHSIAHWKKLTKNFEHPTLVRSPYQVSRVDLLEKRMGFKRGSTPKEVRREPERRFKNKLQRSKISNQKIKNSRFKMGKLTFKTAKFKIVDQYSESKLLKFNIGRSNVLTQWSCCFTVSC